MTSTADYVDRLRCAGCAGIYPEHRYRWIEPDANADEDRVLDLRDPAPPEPAPAQGGGWQRTLTRAWHRRHHRS